MNCVECREHMMASAEGLLDPEESLQCKIHLETCADCRGEYAASERLQERLVLRGHAASGISLVDSVMRRIAAAQGTSEKETTMIRFFSSWPFKLSAAAGVVAALTLTLLLLPGNQAKAAEVLAKGAHAAASLRTIHMVCKLRARPNDNFSSIAADQDFCPVEVWKQLGHGTKWRVEKPGRVAVMDGRSTVQFFKDDHTAISYPSFSSAFDTDWLLKIADLGNTLENELHNAKAQKWKLRLTSEQAADGRKLSVVTIDTKTKLPENDYLRNCFIDHADTRRVYRFDARTGMLETVQIHLIRPSGETLLFESSRIECNQPIDPSIFRLELPADVAWYQPLKVQPADGKYIAMTAAQFARTFFEACSRRDWAEASKFFGGSPIAASTKEYLGGLELRSLGQTFSSVGTTSTFVPYEIKLKGGEVKKWNLAVRRDEETRMWYVDGGI